MNREFESNKMADEDIFANAYHSFVAALKLLASDATTQCMRMGHFNVAWELKNDVSRSARMLELPGCTLTQEEKDAIMQIVIALDDVPHSLLVSSTTETECMQAMVHPSWRPLRTRATQLLTLLSATTRRNEEYFRMSSDPREF